jgi:integrase
VIVNRDPDPLTGKRRRTAHGSYPTKTEAVRELRRVLTEMESGTYIEVTDISLTEYLVNVWLPAHRLVVRPNTAANYEMVIRAHIVPALGNIRLQKLTAPMLTAFYARLVEGNGPTGRPLSAKSVRNLHVIVHKGFKDAVAWGYLVRNPADAAKAPRQGRSKKFSTWTADEVRRFLDHVSGTEFEALYTVLATTAVRRSEVLGLRWCDIDSDRAEMSIVQTVVLVNGAATVSTPKTTRSVRSVSLDAGTVEVLRKHRLSAIQHGLATGRTFDSDALIFVDNNGVPVKPDRVTRTFARLSEEAGLPHIRLHDLRHTWATLALRNGTHPKIVQERLGHANISTTLNTYSHVTPGMQAEAAEEIASLILPTRP